MPRYFKISIIGSGNVAWHLAQSLENAGHSVLEVYSRNVKSAQKLCSKLYEANATESLYFGESVADIFIIAISDKAIPNVALQLVVPKAAIVVHTSGTVSIEALKVLANPKGVIYPIQTFTKSRPINFKEIPLSLEASDNTTLDTLKTLAESLSKKVYLHSTEDRRAIHLSSVFAANFTNHMLTISKGLLESNQLNFELIKPLIAEVVSKALDIGPEHAQTGPAIRNDTDTIEKHLSYLSDEKGLKKIYEVITSDIIRTYDE